MVQKCCEKKRKKENISENKEKSKCTKKSILHFFFLYLIYLIFFGTFIYLYILKSQHSEETKDFEMSHYHGLYTEEAIEHHKHNKSDNPPVLP